MISDKRTSGLLGQLGNIKNDEEFEKIENLGLNNYNYNSNYDNSSMSRWTNYNDDLDMDQQNPDFWDQF